MASEFPSPLLDRLSFLLGKLYFRGLDAETDELSALNLGVKQHAALGVLTREDPMTQQELGHRMGIDRTTIVAVVDDLDEQGLVERRRSPADRRAYLLTVTPSGRDAEERGRHRVAEAEDRLLGALDEPDRTRLRELLVRALGGG
ncbi:MarR family winged helix-turn-helix transcriptional regulator [Streptomonospora wellingtoniae]|uniref:MarR family transcriptional regulator n=1 Tax=Streptomonospora wellingtoniae TaxID=3075544 RepID=A0ABU2L1I6_9ACTN|nr:MarR family transcriptional regulator [Streptomonospora sp. DSM 45055]MDT0305242.1 MarR family transcriptional regulator [Streptomonospora sp. DSM 45055]